ncbi:hypothetical protein [Methanomethylovorans sp.]|uniref:hypothetical protein n=1 Tax=Methanomethylovorans sp. TaxID=2758717 RepID=UPI00345E64D3
MSLAFIWRCFILQLKDEIITSRFEYQFVVLSLWFVCIAWTANLLAMLSLFYKPILLVALLLITTVFVFYFHTYRAHSGMSKQNIIALLFILFFSIFTSLYFHDTFYGGRDPGIYSTNAIYLSEHHTLFIDSAVNELIPHYLSPNNYIMANDGKLISQFHFGYISWVAIYYSLFGIQGIQFSNLLPLFIGLVSIYLIGKEIRNPYAGLGAVLTFSATYPLIWFSRQTVTEIFFMALFWFGVLCCMYLLQRKRNIYYVSSMLAFGMLPFVRIEGLILFSFYFLFLLYDLSSERFGPANQRMTNTIGLDHFSNIRKKDISYFLNRYFRVIFWSIFFLISVLLLYYYFFMQTRYLGVIDAVLNHFSGDIVPSPAGTPAINRTAIRYHFPEFVYMALSEYNLQLPLVSIFLVFIISVTQRDISSKKQLLVIFFMLPGFLYLLSPFITLDQPWFLRRYVATTIPGAFLLMSVLIYDLSKKKNVYMCLMSLVLILNIYTAYPILFFSENDGMIANVGNIADRVGPNDLVLVDRYATGPYKMADPLFFVYSKPALWWDADSVKDLKDDLNVSSFETIYILTNEATSLDKYFNPVELELFYAQTITLEQLEVTVDLNHYPHKEKDVYDMEYSIARRLMKRPANIVTKDIELQLYKVTDSSNMFM